MLFLPAVFGSLLGGIHPSTEVYETTKWRKAYRSFNKNLGNPEAVLPTLHAGQGIHSIMEDGVPLSGL